MDLKLNTEHSNYGYHTGSSSDSEFISDIELDVTVDALGGNPVDIFETKPLEIKLHRNHRLAEGI
jgi:hypothetical protein